MIDRVLEQSAEPPIIILIADHGSWFDIGAEYDEHSDLRERFSILFAASTPRHPDLFPDDVSVGQVLPILFNAYLGTNINVPESRYFFSRTEDILELEEIPDPLAEPIAALKVRGGSAYTARPGQSAMLPRVWMPAG